MWAPCWYIFHLLLLVALNNLVGLFLVVTASVSSVGWRWRLQTAHGFSWIVWHMSRTSSWSISGLSQQLDPLFPYPPIWYIILFKVVSEFHLRDSLDFHGWVSPWHLPFESFLLLLLEERKICHDVFVQVTWHGELGLEFQSIVFVKL